MPKSFAILLEAESHFTDGTVFVIFELALHSVLHGTFSWAYSVKTFFRLAFGGPAVGIAFAIPFIYWINKVSMDIRLGVILTVAGAYICFFVAEFCAKVSGILALEFFGLFIGWYCIPKMNEKFEHTLHTFWGTVTKIMESLLYVLVGFYIGATFTKASHAIHLADCWKFVVFYCFIYAVRLFVSACVWPILRCQNNFGYKELIGFTWGGLRGVMSIVFAMVVAVDVEAGNARFRDLCLFFASAAVLMSSILNGLTVDWVWKKIKLIDISFAHMKWAKLQKAEFIHNSIDNYLELQRHTSKRFADWDDVLSLIGIDAKSEKLMNNLTDIVAKEAEYKKSETYLEKSMGQKLELTDALEEVRLRCYKLILNIAHEYKEQCMCPPSVYSFIQHMVYLEKEQVKKPISFNKNASLNHYEFSDKSYFFLWDLSRMSWIGNCFKYKAYMDTKHGYLTMFNLKTILTEVHENLEDMLTDKQKLSEGHSGTYDDKVYLQAIEEVIGELQTDIIGIRKRKNFFNVNFVDVVSAAQTQVAANKIVTKSIENAYEMEKEGLFEDHEVLKIERRDRRTFRRIEAYCPDWLFDDEIQLYSYFTIFSVLDKKDYAYVKQ